MSAEITMSAILKLVLGGKDQEWSLGTLADDITGTNYTYKTQTIDVATVEEALDLGDCAIPGWILVRNNSTAAAELVYIKTGTGGVNFAELTPGGLPTLTKLPAAMTAPFIISASGVPEIEYLLIER
jgi:hypothetical protein